MRKGAEEAGAIFVVVDRLDGTNDLYVRLRRRSSPRPRPSDRLFQRVIEGQDAEAIRTAIEREMRFDPGCLGGRGRGPKRPLLPRSGPGLRPATQQRAGAVGGFERCADLRQHGLVGDEDADQGQAFVDRQLDDDRCLERLRRILPELRHLHRRDHRQVELGAVGGTVVEAVGIPPAAVEDGERPEVVEKRRAYPHRSVLEGEAADRIEHPRVERCQRLGARLRLRNDVKDAVAAEAAHLGPGVVGGEVGDHHHGRDVDDAGEHQSPDNEEKRPPHRHSSRTISRHHRVGDLAAGGERSVVEAEDKAERPVRRNRQPVARDGPRLETEIAKLPS